MIDCRTTQEWWQALGTRGRERWRVWYGGLKAQWTAPWPWYQRLGAAVRYLLWWGWPFGWRRWWRGVGTRIADVGSWLKEDVLLGFVMLWLPIGVLVWVLGAWLAPCLFPLLGGERELGGALGACLADPPAFEDWGAGALAAAVSLLLQYRHRELRQRAERLQAQWEKNVTDWLFFGRHIESAWLAFDEWRRLPAAVKRKYALRGMEEEDAWTQLVGYLIQRFHSVREEESAFPPISLGSLWVYLARRFPSSRVWDLAVLLERAHTERLRLCWPMVKKVWMDVIMKEKAWARQRLVLSWLLGRTVYWKNRQIKNGITYIAEDDPEDWLLGRIWKNHQGESETPHPTEEEPDDWLLNFRILLASLPLPPEKRSFFMFAWRDERLIREEQKSLPMRSELGSCYDSPKKQALLPWFDLAWTHMLHGEEGKGKSMLHGWVWSSPDARDRAWMWRALHAHLLQEEKAVVVPWRDKEGALAPNGFQKSLLRSLAEAWAEWLRCKPEYFFELLPQRQKMLLNLLFAVWRTPAKVQETLYGVHARYPEWQQVLFEALLQRVASHVPGENDDLTWAALEKWLHLKPPASGPLVLMVSSDQALPAGAMRPALWSWLRSIGVSFWAIVAPEYLPTPMPSEHESGVRWRALRWSAADLEEAWHRHWRACYGVPVEQELPWTAFFPRQERARLEAWTIHAAQDAHGSWSRFVEAMLRRWQKAKEDLTFDERRHRCFDALRARLR